MEEAATAIRPAHMKFIVTMGPDSLVGLRNVEMNLHLPVVFIDKVLNSVSVWCMSPKSSQLKINLGDPATVNKAILKLVLASSCEIELMKRTFDLQFLDKSPMDFFLLKLLKYAMRPYQVSLGYINQRGRNASDVKNIFEEVKIINYDYRTINIFAGDVILNFNTASVLGEVNPWAFIFAGFV